MLKKRGVGFALGSGGSRGVAHIGFLKAMEEHGIKPKYIAGCSMGSVVGAAYAAGLTPDQMLDAVRDLSPFDILQVTSIKSGLFNTKKMRKVLEKHIGDKQFSELKIPFACVAVDMVTQSVVEFKEGSVLDAVVASSSIPAIFLPTEKDGMRLVDGGVLERVPVSLCRDLGARKIVAVDVLGQRNLGQKDLGILGVLLETIDLMDNHRTTKRREELSKYIDVWLEPDLGDMSPYSFKGLMYAYEQGYKMGMEHALDIKHLII